MKNILNHVSGFQIKAVKAGIKASGKLDLGMIIAEKDAVAAGVFTQSKVVAAPVTISREVLATNPEHIRAIIVNAGNANACTGAEGLANARSIAAAAAATIGAAAGQILQCSTGIIGEQMPMAKYLGGIETLRNTGGEMGAEFTEAILTTDLVKKEASSELLGGSIAGVCKGSGMIAPNMATMLGFVLTDINISQPLLQQALSTVVPLTFNAVTVDSDTSTNDTVLLLSSCLQGPEITSDQSSEYRQFTAGLQEVCFSLAEQIARDGEGATKIVRVKIRGAASESDARVAARTVAESPLVKTAMFGCDPNWGRVIAALGRSGCALEESRTDIFLCGELLLSRGVPQKFNAKEVSALMQAKDITITADLNLGDSEMTMLTCDYSYEYIKINAEYHT